MSPTALTGNLVASNTLSFRYNGYNQLANLEDSDNNLTVYTYNGTGLRTSKQDVNGNRQFGGLQ